jgi:hypothetical protein
MQLTRSTLKLPFHGREITVPGEAYLPGHGSPAFVVYTNTIRSWDDGMVMSEEDKEELLRCIAEEAQKQGLRIDFE